MRCPRCKAPMIIIERRQIELDHCLGCHGVWFDGEELELLFGDLGSEEMTRALSRIMTLPPHESPDPPIRCPRCNRKMEHVEVLAGEPVVLDRCRHGDGLWFDAGELHHVVAHASRSTDDAAAPALAFVEEVFPTHPPESDPESQPANQPANQPGSKVSLPNSAPDSPENPENQPGSEGEPPNTDPRNQPGSVGKPPESASEDVPGRGRSENPDKRMDNGEGH